MDAVRGLMGTQDILSSISMYYHGHHLESHRAQRLLLASRGRLNLQADGLVQELVTSLTQLRYWK